MENCLVNAYFPTESEAKEQWTIIVIVEWTFDLTLIILRLKV